MRSLLPWVGTSGDDPGDWIAAVNRFQEDGALVGRIVEGCIGPIAHAIQDTETFVDIRACGHEPPERALGYVSRICPYIGVVDTESTCPVLKSKPTQGVRPLARLSQFGGFLLFECRPRACA